VDLQECPKVRRGKEGVLMLGEREGGVKDLQECPKVRRRKEGVLMLGEREGEV